jgi:hypothetical protein
VSAIGLDELLSLAQSLYGGPASITVTAARVKLSVPDCADRVNCARVDGESAERTIARDLVAHGEIAGIIVRREQTAADYAASAAAARGHAAEARAALERLRAAAEVQP